jgi:two-component system nitrogen regulation response regulator GlnG
MLQIVQLIEALSESEATVLITGESGTGKEVVARAVHAHSPRAAGAFVAVNTGAIPGPLLESELFGHVRGAFTGAVRDRRGSIELAAGGTLFLDEIGDMPPELQTRLLRVLADGEFYRVGGHSPIRVDVRIIAATHQNLERRVAEGQFREDLLHRLNVIRLRLPPLRERPEDIPLLLEHFLKQAAQELDTTAKVPLPEVVEHLVHYPWPGNVRELENTCRWLTVMATGNELHLEDLPPELRQRQSTGEGLDWEAPLARWAQRHVATADEPLLDIALPRMERILIEAALRRTGGRRQEASKLLGWGRNTLTRKIKELGMSAEDSEDEEMEEAAS